MSLAVSPRRQKPLCFSQLDGIWVSFAARLGIPVWGLDPTLFRDLNLYFSAILGHSLLFEI